MSISVNISAQSSVGLYPLSSGAQNNFRLNSLEGNPYNFASTKDWELSAIFGGSLSNQDGTVYLFALAKRLGAHYFYGRYSPGIQKELFFNNGAQILETKLKTTLAYKERFGLGYSYNLSENLSAGFSMRYFEQNFEKESPLPILTDSINYIVTDTERKEYNFWKGDLGFNYKLSEKFQLNISSNNLFYFNESSSDSELEIYTLRKDKTAIFGFQYFPSSALIFNSKIESNSSFTAGLGFNFDVLGFDTGFGIDLFHDKYQDPYIAGVVPSLSFSNEILRITLSGVKYFSDNEYYFVDKFRQEGIGNILNNPYSDDRILLGVNFALSFVPEQKVKFIDIEILKDIYPALEAEYSSEPFAIAKAVNISNKIVTVRPSSFIESINKEIVYSPEVKISPSDTMDIPFYTLVETLENSSQKREIAQARFYISSGNMAEDEMNKPILVNDKNSWDGKVSNLKYFVRKNFDYSNNLAKQILGEKRKQLLTVNPAIENFIKTKILFNDFIDEMLYVSDPRSSVESVQYPVETMQRRGGDCDDLSVGFSSLLESIGIATAFVDYTADDNDAVNHVNLLINTGLSPEQAYLITNNDGKYVVRKNSLGREEVWIPIETTSLTDFDTAWDIAAKKFNNEAIQDLGLAKGRVKIVDIF